MIVVVFIILLILLVALVILQSKSQSFNYYAVEEVERKNMTMLDPPDSRDFLYGIPLPSGFTQVSQDWSSFVNEVLDQETLGSCSSNAGAQAISIYENAYKWKHNLQNISPLRSRLYVYYDSRVIYPGTSPIEDTGTCLRATMKALVKKLPYESEWKYILSNVNVTPPNSIVLQNNIDNQVFSYYRVPLSMSALKSALLRNVIICRINCPKNLPNKNGVLNPIDLSIVNGGHAVLIVGFNDETKQIKILNSWSTKWGLNGYGFIPYEYIGDYVTDMWILYMDDMSLTSWGTKFGSCKNMKKDSWIEYSDVLKPSPNSRECWFRYCVNPDKTTCGLASDSTPKYTGCYVNDTLGKPKTMNESDCV